MPTDPNRRRSERIEIRATPEERALIDRAVAAWCMASLAVDIAPPRLRKGAERYPQRVALLARLGVSIHHERRGLGAGLLQDVIARTAESSGKSLNQWAEEVLDRAAGDG